MKEIIFLVIVPLISGFLIGVFINALALERKLRKKAEQELQSTKKSLKELCEACIEENNSIHARITYEAYFGKPVDHTGDGFIDGYE